MIEIKKYDSSHKTIWDTFITISRVNTFLFQRDFMEYHSDRFEDFSLLIYRKGKLEAVLPGNIKHNVFYTHQGLTYGGLVTSAKITAIDVLTIFEEVNLFLKESGINEVLYKAIPLIYHKQPMQEDVYALYRLKADKISCTLSSTIFTKNKIYIDIFIYNINGQLLTIGRIKNTNNLTIDVSYLLTGTYILELEGHEKKISEKFVKD